MYATIAQVRATPGAVPSWTDEQITAALGDARRLIDAYTGEWWEPTDATIVGRIGADGLVLLPFRAGAVTAVQIDGTGTDLPATAYRVTSSSTVGALDAVQLGAQSYADPLVVGAEPWRGGFANLFRGAQRVRVTGTFGHTDAPPEIADAAVALAVWRLTGGSLVRAAAPDTDDEGNTVTITVDAAAATRTSPTTGLGNVDAALVSLVRRHALIG